MPTGYTYPVAEGSVTTLREFAMLCARAFGATIMMRDEPLDAAIPEQFEPDTKFYDELLATARATLAELPTLSDEECERRAAEEYHSALSSHREYEATRQLENKRIRDMQAAVSAWNTEAEGIKDFMLQQLSISVSEYHSRAPTKLSGRDWRIKTLERAAEDVGRHEKHIADERTRTADRNKWLADLRASLPAA